MTLINTDAISPISDNMKSIASKATQVLSSVNGYSIDSTKFDFSGAKNAIANNIEGMEIKMKNSSTLLSAVVGTHESYQKSADGGNETGGTDTGNYTYTGGNSSHNNSYYGGTGSGNTANTGTLMNYSQPTTPQGDETAIKSTEEQSLLVASMLGNDVKSNIILQTLANTMNLFGITLAETGKLSEILNKNEKLVILEGISTAIETIEYTRIVGKVCTEYGIPVKYVNLDKILTYKDSEEDKETASINAKSTVSTLTSSDKVDDSEEKDEKGTEVDLDKDESEKEISNKDDKKEDDSKDSKDSKEEKSTEENDAYEIKDEKAYKELQSLSFKSNVKHDLTKTPVTLMIKNKMVVGSINDAVTEEVLKKALEAAGLTTK